MSHRRAREGSSFSDERRSDDRSGPIFSTDRLYDLLQLSRDASHETVKKTYRQFALLWHPDKGGDVQRFQALTAAWEVLGDETRRSAYDRSLIRTGSTDGLGVNVFGNSCSDGGGTVFSRQRRRHSTEAGNRVREFHKSNYHEGRKQEDTSSGDGTLPSREDVLRRSRGECAAPRRESHSFPSGGNANTSADPESTERKTERPTCTELGDGNSHGHNSWNHGGRDLPQNPRKSPSQNEIDARWKRQSNRSFGSDKSKTSAGKDEGTPFTGISGGSVRHRHSGNHGPGNQTNCIEEALREVLGEEQFKAAVQGSMAEKTIPERCSAGCAKQLVNRLSVKQLKHLLTTLGIPHLSCIEKTDLLEAFSAAFSFTSPSPNVNFSPQTSGQKDGLEDYSSVASSSRLDSRKVYPSQANPEEGSNYKKQTYTPGLPFTTACSSSFCPSISSMGSSKSDSFDTRRSSGGECDRSVPLLSTKKSRKSHVLSGSPPSLLGAAAAANWVQEQNRMKLKRDGYPGLLASPFGKINMQDMMHFQGEELRMKILAMGAEKTGKSCIIKRYCEGRFVVRNASTIGIDYGVKLVEVEGAQARVNFFDFSGRKEFSEIRQSFYDHTDGVLLVVDVTRRETFDELPAWINEAKAQGLNIGAEKEKRREIGETVDGLLLEDDADNYELSSVPVVLLANKDDMSGRCVLEAEISAFAESHGMRFFETSANTNHNISKALETLFSIVARRVLKARKTILSQVFGNDLLKTQPSLRPTGTRQD
uniref:Ras-associated protein Rap1 isoform 1 family protein n=1 Tax=Toxoplasma gondii COUG TaxID=1074873 RepID=A0A2G8Y5B7_TOXGO|nr:Ras-associated protein Rap1 isoform 1 family protein [Toxoplasma gondii COUG]